MRSVSSQFLRAHKQQSDKRAVTSRKEDIGPPQKYQNESDPILVLEIIPGHFGFGTFEVDGKIQVPFGTKS